MTVSEYKEIESFMLEKMKDSAHDKYHIYRVLNHALDISRYEENVDMDILITACLLHDIGRQEQFKNPEVCHAQAGAAMAYEYLVNIGWPHPKADHVKKCIAMHRYRSGNIHESIESRILFDADKLDITGAVGIARTLIYGGEIGEPMYLMEAGRIVTEGGAADSSSFVQEYNYKLKNLYTSFHTKRGKELAEKRRKTAELFYESFYKEVSENNNTGSKILLDTLEE